MGFKRVPNFLKYQVKIGTGAPGEFAVLTFEYVVDDAASNKQKGLLGVSLSEFQSGRCEQGGAKPPAPSSRLYALVIRTVKMYI